MNSKIIQTLKSDDANEIDDQTEVLDAIQFAKIASTMESFSKLINGFCPDEIVDLGAMIIILDELIVNANACRSKTLSNVAGACKHYIESMTLEQLNDIKPLEEALILLRAVQRHLKHGTPFIFETEDILKQLGGTC